MEQQLAEPSHEASQDGSATVASRVVNSALDSAVVISKEASSTAPAKASTVSPARQRRRQTQSKFGNNPYGQERTKYRPRQKWGNQWDPSPNERQLCREVDSLFKEHCVHIAENHASFSSNHSQLIDDTKQLSMTIGSLGYGGEVDSFGSLSKKRDELAYKQWVKEHRQANAQAKQPDGDDVIGDATVTSASRSQMTRLPPWGCSNHASSSPMLGGAEGKKKKYEPAKVVGADGKVRLRGVRSTSDINRYTKDIDPYSRKGWEVREAFKQMRSSEHARTATTTWSALRSWYSTDKPLDEWYSTTKGGIRNSSLRTEQVS
eukprot:TRINITY_DN29170_c2_g1_i1.p1 TRINITY_DN29170_c2_g1~~TRINITY_DN29170_c2_g1_i1.p1  ORF type:complete len:319 (-),score=59.65 TRINITY_DN29170_c2_g1_i1:172-1128(-)